MLSVSISLSVLLFKYTEKPGGGGYGVTFTILCNTSRLSKVSPMMPCPGYYVLPTPQYDGIR